MLLDLILLGPQMFVQYFASSHLIVVEIFQVGPKRWTNWHCSLWSHVAIVANNKMQNLYCKKMALGESSSVCHKLKASLVHFLALTLSQMEGD